MVRDVASEVVFQNNKKIKRHFQRPNVTRSIERNDQLVYRLDCEVESGHDNPGQQYRQIDDKNVSSKQEKSKTSDRTTAQESAHSSKPTSSRGFSSSDKQTNASNVASLHHLLIQFPKDSGAKKRNRAENFDAELITSEGYNNEVLSSSASNTGI